MPLFFNEKMVSLLLAMAAEEILDGSDGNMANAWWCEERASLFRLMIENGCADYKNIKSKMTGSRFWKTKTERALKMQVARSIPCSCLDEAKAEAKAMGHMRKCNMCDKEGPLESF